MTVRNVAQNQYRQRVNQITQPGRELRVPKEGWIRTVRKALGMSGAQLARRLGVTRASVSNTEKAELAGGVTLRNMQHMAEAMGCRFVYAIVPDGQIEDIIKEQARKKAQATVARASDQMALEAQTLSPDNIEYEVEQLQQAYIKDMPSDLWND